MKKRIFLISIIIAMSLVFTLPQKRVKAATMPKFLFTNHGRLIMQVSDIGMLGSSEWELMVYTEWPSPVNIGLGMRFYMPSRKQFGIHVFPDARWAAHGHFGVWSGSGSIAHGIGTLSGVPFSEVLTTSPPVVLSGDSGPVPDNK